MNSDVLLIVLTGDSWLYAGLAALLPEIACLQVGFSAGQLPREIRVTRHVILAVDSRIVFQGEWSTFNALKKSWPDASVVWLARKETGRVFPVGSRGDRIEYQQQDIATLHLALRQVLQREEPQRDDGWVGGIDLTRTEQRLLPLFLSGVSMSVLSRLTGSPVKTLYVHRRKILSKTGFRHPTFLQFVYERNQGIPGIPWLDYPKNEYRRKYTVNSRDK